MGDQLTSNALPSPLPLSPGAALSVPTPRSALDSPFACRGGRNEVLLTSLLFVGLLSDLVPCFGTCCSDHRIRRLLLG